MEIRAPTPFRDATRNITTETIEWAQSIDMLGRGFLNGVDPQEGLAIREFIDQVLSANYDDETLKLFWQSTPSDIYFDDGNVVRKLLEAILAHLKRPPYVDG